MKPVTLKMKCALALVIGSFLAAGPVMADKPAGAGGGKGGKEAHGNPHSEQSKGAQHDDGQKSGHDSSSAEKHGHFNDQHRVMVREYYTEQFRGGHCPPGLAKKNNGCMPPGQAKKWQVGQPLPRDVVYYSVPQQLVVQIGPPPSGYRYVRVATDILMIAIGTGMVVDAIQDLGR